MRGPVDPTQNEPLYNYTLMPNHMRDRFGVKDLQDIQLAEPFSFTKGCRTMKIASAHPFGERPPRYTMLFDLATDSEPGESQSRVWRRRRDFQRAWRN